MSYIVRANVAYTLRIKSNDRPLLNPVLKSSEGLEGPRDLRGLQVLVDLPGLVGLVGKAYS